MKKISMQMLITQCRIRSLYKEKNLATIRDKDGKNIENDIFRLEKYYDFLNQDYKRCKNAY
jgi:hypothetical protein